MTMKCALSHNFPPIRSGERGLPLLVRATLPCGRSCWGLLGILPEWRLLFRVASAPPPRISRGFAFDAQPHGTFSHVHVYRPRMMVSRTAAFFPGRELQCNDDELLARHVGQLG